MKQSKIKKVSGILISLFYILAGINHFWHAGFYYELIPDYLPAHNFINIFSGIAEIVLGIGIFFKQTKFLSAVGIIILLILFLPAHIWFIQKGGCMGESLCVPVWVAWVRLIVFHPLLIAWAWWHRK